MLYSLNNNKSVPVGLQLEKLLERSIFTLDSVIMALIATGDLTINIHLGVICACLSCYRFHEGRTLLVLFVAVPWCQKEEHTEDELDEYLFNECMMNPVQVLTIENQ